MAGEWIKYSKGLHERVEVLAIARQLDLSPFHVVGALMRFWDWCDDNTTSGVISCNALVTLDALTGVTGFAQALIKVGWLEQLPGGFRLPNFDRHNSKSAKRRALTQRRVKRCRNAGVTPRALPEKRREEKSKKKTASSSARTPKTHREPNPIWDTICELFDLNPLPRSQASRIGKVARDLEEVGATPDEICRRFHRAQEAWEGKLFGPEALVKQWGPLGQTRRNNVQVSLPPDLQAEAEETF